MKLIEAVAHFQHYENCWKFMATLHWPDGVTATQESASVRIVGSSAIREHCVLLSFPHGTYRAPCQVEGRSCGMESVARGAQWWIQTAPSETDCQNC